MTIKLSNNISEKKLLDYGFIKLSKTLYQYRVPAYKYKHKLPLLFLEFYVDYDKDNRLTKPSLTIECKNRDGNIYFPFYDNNYTNNNLVLRHVNKVYVNIIADMIKNEILNKNNRREND